MLWFANASDGPTWYVGKKEEFGQARGWLQVKSDAASPAEIRGTWGIWSAAEKVWKDGRDVKCVAVSATPGVYIFGITPNNLLQDKLGEYRRVQLRVITERGVYEMVGMSNVMMWYAPGGTWNIGKRDELGQNRGWYQAVSKAISPEGITNWQVWDGASRKWEKANELQARLTAAAPRRAAPRSAPRCSTRCAAPLLTVLLRAAPALSLSHRPPLRRRPSPSARSAWPSRGARREGSTWTSWASTCAAPSTSRTAARCTSRSTRPTAQCGTPTSARSIA
jgi:hypothetical protein